MSKLQLQLFIEGKQVELHDNESVTLTQTLQNVRDISKIFTDFTQTFNVPASKNNNKIFKHFYNFNIQGFDARNKKEAELYLNYEKFKDGKIKLEGVQMSNNKPINYRITFFGNTVNLKDKLGEDKLDALSMLSDFKIQYDATNVINLMGNPIDIVSKGETFTDAVLVPLITHTQRLYYNSTEDITGSGNLYVGGSNVKGVKFQELKPALRAYVILKSIEKQYNIKFSTDFFNKNNPAFYNLYLWLHRKKGGVLEENETVQEVQFTGFGQFAGDSSIYSGFTSTGFTNRVFGNPKNVNRDIQVDMTVAAGTRYDFIIKKNGEEWFREDGNVGSKNFVNFSSSYKLESGTDNYTFFVVSEDAASFSANVIVKENVKRLFGWDSDKGSGSSTITLGTDIDVFAATQVPKIKVLDFLTGLFKMFNLTAFQENDTIVVKTLDSFYASSTITYNITKHLDKTSGEVNAIMPYSEIEFKYDGTDTIFAKQHEEFTNLSWGTAHFNNKQIYEGGRYEVKLPFEHHKYERLLDLGNNNQQTSVQWGWSVDDNQSSYLGKPLLFYPHKITSGTAISVLPTTSTSQSLTTYYIPSNSVNPTTSSQSINFNAELSEYTNTVFSNSLFDTFYKTYITDTFDINRRLSKFQAYLPLSVTKNIKLQDKVIVFTNLYKINSLVTNFETGLTKLELINEVTNFKTFTNDNSLARTIDASLVTVDSTIVTADTGIIKI